MTNKNGFEIRLEVLKMAKEVVEKQYAEASAAYWQSITKAAEQWNTSVEETMKKISDMSPKMYTPADIMSKAQELYGFVSKKD
jgi:hypothetical protein